jgi:uncharacterized protein YjdB/DNA/RNA endonuclease G (NUC1)
MLKRIFRLCSLFSLLGLFAACGGQELEVPVSSVSVNQPSAELTIGQTLQLSATVSPYDATNKDVLWTSANPSVASVSGGGLVTAVAEGHAEITASAGGKKASCKITVSKGVVEVSSVELDKTELSLIKGESETLMATIKPADATQKTVTWTSSDPLVARVDQDGQVLAHAGGTAVITAKAGEKSASCTVTVTVPVESVSLDRESITLLENESATLTATVSPDDATDAAVAWSSSNTAVATVEGGKVTAIKEGTATITAKAGDKTASCEVTVKKKVIPVESISLDKTSLSLLSGDNETLTATVKPDDATDKSVSWSSSNPAVAAVDQKGQVRAESGGTAIITARAGDKTATCTVTVTVPVEKISLDRTSVTLKVDESVTLTATVKPSDATDKTVSWSSSNPAIAKVENGKVTAISEGSATITAKAGEKTATCSVTVVKPDEPDTPDPDDPDPDDPDEPSATGIVVTQPATGITSGEATLNAYYYEATGSIAEAGFFWGTSMYALTQTAYVDPPAGASNSFSATISSLTPGTTYYYKAFIVEYDAALGKYVDRLGSVQSFTTEIPAPTGGPGYLGCFEVPALNNLDGTGDSGDKYGKWWSYGTTNPLQKVVTHTYVYNGKQYRNYTVLVDGSKRAPLWTAHVAHKGAYPNKGVGRVGSWGYDPAVPTSWQQSGVSGYSKGHFVASSDRQTCTYANYQTFFYTNQAPQYQTKFNDGVWSSLESAIQSNAPSNSDTLYVVTGVLYEDNNKVSGIPIPSHFYKCLMKCSFSGGTMTAARGVAYLFENRAYTTNYQANATSIDAVEARSGFDFFANVPAALQNAAETTSTSIW